MYFAKVLLMGALAAVAYAQSKITITSAPTAAVGGKQYIIKWTGGDSTKPVSLVLREGPSDHSTVLSTITNSATGGSFEWNVPNSLTTSNDYAIQIVQDSDSNYWALSITGSGTSTLGASTASSTSKSSSTSSESSTTTGSSTSSSVSSHITSTRNSTVTSHTLKPTKTSSENTESTGTSSSSAPSESTSAPNAGTNLKSNAALVLGAIAAIAYLG